MMQLVAPKVKMIQTKYKDDKDTMNRLMLRLYDDCGINPLGGCGTSVIQFPIFIGLYRSINQLVEKNDKVQEPFLWIPSLAGPIQPGSPGLDWLLKSKLADGFEPSLGWTDAGRYLILPVALVFSQWYTQRVANPQQAQAEGPQQYITLFFPLIIGYSCLVSPAGLGIYWFTNNLLTQAQTIFIKNGLAEEFPEYRKIMDGTAEKEREEKRKALEEAKKNERPEIKTKLGLGFAEMAEALGDDEEEEEEEKEPVTVAAPPKVDKKKIARRRAAAKRGLAQKRTR